MRHTKPARRSPAGHRNPVARALRTHPGGFGARSVPSGKLYRRRARHRGGDRAPEREGWD